VKKVLPPGSYSLSTHQARYPQLAPRRSGIAYFTAPAEPAAENYSGGPDESLAQAIDEARLSVDVAIYDLDLSTISKALINGHRRGVLVRVVTDSDNMDSLATKIPVWQVYLIRSRQLQI
jgi:phosphatidylserine/phosphatidylglycerophosphate/cardiolipin synthase-like enzyme